MPKHKGLAVTGSIPALSSSECDCEGTLIWGGKAPQNGQVFSKDWVGVACRCYTPATERLLLFSVAEGLEQRMVAEPICAPRDGP